jgi:hypothetical protein
MIETGSLPLTQIQKSPDLLRQTMQALMVYQSDGSDFEVKLSSDLPFLDLKSERGPKGDRYQITVNLNLEKIEVSPIKGSIFIETNDPSVPNPTIPVTGATLEQ